MKWSVLGNVEPATAERFRAFAAGHTTLEKAMLDWFAYQPALTMADVIKQDEFTHDVVVPLRDCLALVYGSS